MGYKWDKKQLFGMLRNPESRSDLRNLLMQNFDFMGVTDGLKKSTESKLQADAKLLRCTSSLNNYLCNFEKNALENFDLVKPTPGVISKEDALEIVRKYYEHIGGVTYEAFTTLFEKRNKNLKFVNNNRQLGSKTIICPSDNEVYMFVNFDGSVESICTIIHEYAHAIGYKIRPFEYRELAQGYFCEIESIFHTLLSLDFLEDIIPEHKDAIQNERKGIVNDTIRDTNSIRQKKLILSAIEDYPDEERLTLKAFKNFLIENYYITPEELDNYLSTPAENILPYLIGEYTSFELYHLYEENPTYAMMIYNIIIKIKADSIEDYFNQIESLNIHLGTNVESYVRKIKA